ncbi:YncE family protein [Paraburkholderia sp. RL17-383-BIF-A]|uniref:YncE family protein n=1 Tax=unclassified Paraburkholderia TaxID=2615204 RepID=UPI0038B7E5FF
MFLTLRASAAAALAIVVIASVSNRTNGTEEAVEASNLPLQKVADVPLGGGTTRFDYESFDPSRHLLFIAHLGDSEVVAFNTEMSRVVGRVANVSSVHGVLAIPELGRVYASATAANEVVAIDMATLGITARMPTGAYPDGMAYAPDAHKLYVSDEADGTVTVVDVTSNRRVGTIPLGGEAGNTQYDPVWKHIFVNVQTRNQLVEIDPTSDRILARVDLPGAKGNHGLLIASDQMLAFIACEGNDRLIVLDMRTRRVTSSFEVGKEPDVLAYDPSLHWLYVAGEAGVVSMFRVGAGGVSKLGDGHVGPNAHVVAVDVETHRAYFPLKNFGGQTMLRILQPKH